MKADVQSESHPGGTRLYIDGLITEAMTRLRSHDAGLGALRRAGRTAVCMPAAFALGMKVVKSPNVSIFCAFGSLALLLLVDFRGPTRDRIRAQVSLAVVGAAFVCLGTLASRSEVIAAVAMALVGVVVIFAGVISSVLANATIPLLLAFILPVSLGGPASVIPDRLGGWGIASGLSLIAITFLWPAPVQVPLRQAAIGACRALAARLRVDAGDQAGAEPASDPERAAVDQQAAAAVAAVGRLFTATPYRPAGLSTGSRALVRLVDELRWVAEIMGQSAPAARAELGAPQIQKLSSAAATVLDRGADLLTDSTEVPIPLRDAVQDLRDAMAELEREVTEHVPSVDTNAYGDVGKRELDAFLSRLEPGFRGQEMSFVVAQIAGNIELGAAAERRSWTDRLAGRQPDGVDGPLASVRARAGAHLNRRSVWLHNSLRGGIALGLAVLFGELLKLEHSFWVVLGVLTILRSSALSTGQTAANAMLGTVVGFIVGGSLVQLIGANETVLWLLLPVAVLLAGFSPVAISFAAGQAAFTFTLLILFNLFAPAGWHIGVVRIEDVAIGAGTCLVVGVLFWPRGAGAALTAALSDAYAQSAEYLRSAVAFATSCCDSSTGPQPAPTAQAAHASAAARRLDDAFRGYVAERGSKRLPLSEATALVNGPSALRLAGDAILDLWQAVAPSRGSRAQATRELMARADAADSWYHGLAAALDGKQAVPQPVDGHQTGEDDQLLQAIERDLRDGEEAATAAAVRIIWTSDHLDTARRLQGTLVSPAREAQLHNPGTPGRHDR